MFKLTCITFFLVALQVTCSGQKIGGNENFKKYSYLIAGINVGAKDTGEGTAFFLHKGRNLYLVTAYHVFFPVDLDHEKFRNPWPTKLLLRYPIKNSRKFGYYTIVTAPLYKNLKIQSEYDLADVYAYKIAGMPKNAEIYCVDSLLPPDPFFFETRSPVFYHGFPYSSFKGERLEMATYTQTAETQQNSNQIVKLSDANKNLVYYYTISTAQNNAGFSGSPVFAFLPNNKVYLIGLFSGSGKLRGMVTRYAEILKSLY